MKKVLAFDIDQTLNVAKTPITDDIADLLVKCLDHFEVCPISGQNSTNSSSKSLIVSKIPPQSNSVTYISLSLKARNITAIIQKIKNGNRFTTTLSPMNKSPKSLPASNKPPVS